MAFPVGVFPGPTDLGDKFVPVKSGSVFTGGGADMDLTDPTNGCNPCALTLYVTVSGNLDAVLAGDAGSPTFSSPVVRTYPVVAGQELQGAFVLLKGSSTASCIPRR